MSVQESPAEAWVSSGVGLGALNVAMHAWDLLKEVAFISIASTTVWSQLKEQGGNTAPPINKKLD